MVIRNNDWYNLNSTRHYPLDDNATGDVDGGGDLPSNIIVDCRLRFPRLAGKYIYISSVNVTENLVSVTFLAAQNVTAEKNGQNFVSEFAPVAVATVLNPTEYRPYPIEALYPGVSGWIVFGSGIKEVYRADFTNPEQTLLTPSAARWYSELPIPSAQKEGVSDKLTGLVKLKGSNTVNITARESVLIDGVERRAIVIAVKDDLPGLISLESLVGPCGKRPESRTCDALPIEYINTVDPDCDGNIEIRFIGALTTVYPYASLSSSSEIPTAGLEIDFGLGVTDACVTQECLPDDTGKLCNEYDDLCESSSSQSISSESSSSLSLSICATGNLPYGTSFDNSTAEDFVVKSGTWDFKDLDTVGITESATAEEQGHGAIVPGADIVYRPTDKFNRNVSIWDSCDYEALTGLTYMDISRERRVWTDVYIPTDVTAGLVLNYRNSPYTGNPHYFFVGIDTLKAHLILGKFAGNAWTTVASDGTVPLLSNTWYRIAVHVSGVFQVPESTLINANVYKITTDLISNWPDEDACTPHSRISIATNAFGKITLGSKSTYSYDGHAGLFAEHEAGYAELEDNAYFSHFNFDKAVDPPGPQPG